MLDLKKQIAEARAKLDYLKDPEATAKDEQLQGMDISCDAVIIFAERHAELAEKWRPARAIQNARQNFSR